MQLACDLRNVGEKYAGLLHRHVQHVGDGLVLVLDLERFTVVALALADVTGHVNIRQKVHFNRQNAAAFAGFAASALDIEAEPPGAVAAHFGILCVGKQRADVAKHACVGGRVGARRAANRRLVDADDLIDPLHALDLLTLAGAAARTVQGGSQRFVQNFVDKRRLAGAGHAGNADQLAEREVYGNVLQIVLMGLDDAQRLAVSLAACLGNLYEFAARQIRASDAALDLADVRDAACGDDLAAVDARTGADIDNIVGLTHRVLIVLNDDQRVAKITQPLHRCNQLIVVTLVQADARLIEHVEHAGQRTADLGRQTDALALAAGQRSRTAGERQIAKADAL